MTSPDEIVLSGGRANVGRVVLIGDQVARPSYPQTPTVDLFLAHLRDHGIDFVPEPLGTDEQGRQRLRYIEGEVPVGPYPSWAYDEVLLVDVAMLQRQMHQAAASFEAPTEAIWATSAGDYFPAGADGDLVCHNDLGMSNTVVDPATASVAGFIDFDYCRPVNRLFDIAVAARHWVPFGDLDVSHGERIDRVHRFRLFCEAHELTERDRSTVVKFAIAFLEQARRNIRGLAARGHAGFQALLDDGYEAVNEATVRWLISNRTILVAAG